MNETSAEQPASASPSSPDVATEGASPGTLKRLFWVCGCAWIGSLIGWLLITNILPVYHLPSEFENLPDLISAERMNARDAATDETDRKNWMVGMAIVASCTMLGLLLGSWQTAHPPLPFRALLLALVLGIGIAAGAGAGAVWLADLLRVRLRESPDMDSMQRSVLGQIVLLTVTGAGLGLGLSLLRCRTSQLLQYAVSIAGAGLIAGFLHPLLGGLFILRTDTELLIPRDTPGQLLWITVLSLCFGLTACSIQRGRKAKTAP